MELFGGLVIDGLKNLWLLKTFDLDVCPIELYSVDEAAYKLELEKLFYTHSKSSLLMSIGVTDFKSMCTHDFINLLE